MEKKDLITAVIAGYGAILSTVVCARQVLADRVKVQFTAAKGMEMVGDPRYAGMTILVLRATNVGKRPVTITTMGALRFHPLTNLVAHETTPRLPCELTEGQFVESIWPETDLDYSTIDYWGAWDSRGKKHVLHEASHFKHWKAEIQRRFRIMKHKSA